MSNDGFADDWLMALVLAGELFQGFANQGRVIFRLEFLLNQFAGQGERQIGALLSNFLYGRVLGGGDIRQSSLAFAIRCRMSVRNQLFARHTRRRVEPCSTISCASTAAASSFCS